MSVTRLVLVSVLVLMIDVRPAKSQDAGNTPAKSARQSAPIDLTGNWVSYVTEDWRFRMITPPKGDYTRVPLTPEGRKVADGWNPAADEAAGQQCKAYGGAAIMRMPARFRITWHDDQTLRIDSDTGMQTRMFHFARPPTPRARTWQGQSIANWDTPSRKLVVTTTSMRAGYLRRNGVPYSTDARVTEYFVVAPVGQIDPLLVVTTIVEDPRYLQRPFVVSSHFKRDTDPAKWNPTPCVATW